VAVSNRNLGKDFQQNNESGLGNFLRNIERDNLIGRDAAARSGLASGVGSGWYLLKENHPELYSEWKKKLPELPELSSSAEIDKYLPEGMADIGSSINEIVEEYNPITEEGIEEAKHHLNKNVETMDEFEGVGKVKNFEDLKEEFPAIIEHSPEIIATSFDNLMHLAITGFASSVAAGTVDRLTEDYDPKKIAAAGMSMPFLYVACKEGMYEGGSGMNFDFQNTDVQGDIMADFIGGAWATYSYHKDRVQTEDRTPGALGKTARKAGRLYARVLHAAGNAKETASSSLSLQQEDAEDLDEDYGLIILGPNDIDSIEDYLEDSSDNFSTEDDPEFGVVFLDKQLGEEILEDYSDQGEYDIPELSSQNEEDYKTPEEEEVDGSVHIEAPEISAGYEPETTSGSNKPTANT
jgi:hypothetical protein